MGRRLTPEQREHIAADAVARYRAGETWQQIGASHGITGEHVRQLTVARFEVIYRRGGSSPSLTRRRSVDGVTRVSPSPRSPTPWGATCKPCGPP